MIRLSNRLLVDLREPGDYRAHDTPRADLRLSAEIRQFLTRWNSMLGSRQAVALSFTVQSSGAVGLVWVDPRAIALPDPFASDKPSVYGSLWGSVK